MSITELPENKPAAPTDLTETSESTPANPTNLTETAESTPAVPSNLTEVAESAPANPSNLAEVSESTPAIPTNLTETAESTPGNPTSQTKVSESAPAIPTNLTEVSESTPANPTSQTKVSNSAPAIPTNLTEVAESSPANPSNLTEVSESTPAVPTDLTEVSAKALPRSLTPRIDLNFGINGYELNGVAKAIDDIVTYSRSSSATYIERYRNQFGQYDYRLVEDFVGTVTNLVTYSEQFDNADWTKTRLNVSSVNELNPLGFVGGVYKLVEDTSNNTHFIESNSVSFTSSSNYTFSFYAKAKERSEVYAIFETAAFPAGSNAYFNLESGIARGFGSANSIAKVDYVGDGWYRCSITETADATISTTVQIFTVGSAGGITYTGDGESGVYIWGAQLTESSKPEPYVKTLSSSASETFTASPRLEYDPSTGESLGYLSEGSSTNLATYSEEFDNAAWNKQNLTVTGNNVIAPDGSKSGDTLDALAGTVIANINDGFTVTASTTYTFSFYAQAGTNQYLQTAFGTGQVAGNPRVNWDLQSGAIVAEDANIDEAVINEIVDGWYRCVVTVTSASTTLQPYFAIIKTSTTARLTAETLDGSETVHIWGAQLEAQPFATSYIRTEGSTVSRSADDLTVTNPPIPLLLQKQTVHVVSSLTADDTTGTKTRTFFGTDVDSFRYFRITTSGNLEFRLGDNSAVNSLSSFDVENSTKYTGTSDGVTIKTFIEGSEQASTAAVSGSDASFTKLVVGNSGHVSTQPLFGHIKQLTIYDVALTADEVALL